MNKRFSSRNPASQETTVDEEGKVVEDAQVDAVAATTCSCQRRRDAGSMGTFPFAHQGLWAPFPLCTQATHADLRVPLFGNEWQLGSCLFGVAIAVYESSPASPGPFSSRRP